MNISGQAQAELIKIGAFVLLGAMLIYGADAVVKKITDAIDKATGKAGDTARRWVTAPFTPADQPWTTDAENPEWTHVQTQGFDFLTQNPRQFTQTKLDLYAVDP